MKRSWIVAAAVGVTLLLAIVLLARRGGGPTESTGGDAVTLEQRVYENDSLGVRIRIPDSPGWTLKREAPRPDGSVVSATHVDGTATVRLLARPATAETTVDGVFEARQRQVASTFGLDRIDRLVAQVIHDEHRDVMGRSFRQWQAVTNPIEAPGEPASRVVFMWLMTATPKHSLECIGLVRFPAELDADAQAKADGLLRDVGYILQSFEVK